MAKKSMTAAEVMARLANDPEYQRKIREKESQREKLEKELTEDESVLISELQAVGVNVRSVWDLVNSRGSYRPAIPVLVRHLDVTHHPRTIQGIVRALTTPEGKGIAFTHLVRMFERTDDGDSELKWLLGAAIAETCTSDNVDEVIKLAHDVRHGRGRTVLPLGLVAASKEKALPILACWTNDSTLEESARTAIQILEGRSE